MPPKPSPGDYVLTPGGVGKLHKITGGKAVVEMDYLYLVVFPLESIKPYYLEEAKMEIQKYASPDPRLELFKDFLALLSQRIKEYEENQEFLRQQVISETEMFLSILKAGGPEK